LAAIGLLRRDALFEAADRQLIERGVVGVQRKADLVEVVLALVPPCGFASGLHGGQQEGDERADDRHDNQ
jgi:hypothetical protein